MQYPLEACAIGMEDGSNCPNPVKYISHSFGDYAMFCEIHKTENCQTISDWEQLSLLPEMFGEQND